MSMLQASSILILLSCSFASGLLVERNITVAEMTATDTSSFLEVESTRSKLDRCSSTGDTHVRSFRPHQRFNVMGEDEWVLAEGPTHRSIAKWVVQGTQRRWAHNARNDVITVLKNIGLRCGNFFVLVEIPQQGHGGDRKLPILGQHSLFVKGSNRATAREYNSRNFLEDADFQSGRSVSFDDGAGRVGVFTTVTNRCTRGECLCRFQNNFRSDCSPAGIVRNYTLECQGTFTSIVVEQRADGGALSHVHIDVPISDDSANIRVGDHLGVSGNLVGGYCGGWDAPTSRAVKRVWDTCGVTKPEGFRPNEKTMIEYCKSSFTTTPSTSIFSAFETWTGRSDLSRFESNDAAAAIIETKDMAAFNREKQRCIVMASRVDTSVPFRDNPTNPREANVLAQVLDCAEDSMYGLVWDEEKMKQDLCQVNGFKIRQERKDIFCAARELFNQGRRIDPTVTISPLVSTCKTPTDVNSIKESTATIPRLLHEVQSSTEGIAYWNTPLCEALIPDETDLSATNCDSWNFVDTMTELNNGFGNTIDRFVASGVYALNHQGKAVSFEKGNFDSSVIFLGAPTFSDTIPAVPRVSKINENSFQLFLATDRCSNSRSHGGETLNYVVLENNFNYGENVFVFRTTLDGSWRTVEFGKNMGDPSRIRIFTTIQSTQNGACFTCSSFTARNGFITVRVRSITATTAQFRIQADREAQTIVSETVGVLIVNTATGTIAGKKFITMAFSTAQTATTNCGGTALQRRRCPPSYTREVDFGNNFKTIPVQLYQVVNDDNLVSPNIRIVTYDNPKTVMTIDRDICDSRAHPAVTVHVLALEPTGPW